MQRSKAIHNQDLAQSSLYSVLAFQNLDKDPTHAIRLAQQAYNVMPSNPWAWSAVISAFYHTGLFYQVPDTLDFPFTWATIEPSTSKVLAIYTNAGKSIVYLYKKPILRQIDNKAVQNFAMFLPDSGFVTGGWDSTLHFYNPDAHKLREIKLEGIIWSAAQAPDKRLAFGLSTGEVVVIDSNYNIASKIKLSNSDIWSLAFSQTGMLAASSQDNMIKILDSHYNIVRQIPVYKTFDYQYFYIAPLSFSSDGQYIAAALNDFANDYYVVRVWTIDGQELVNTRMAEQWINDMQFVKDKDVIITASKDGAIRWFDIKTGSVKRFLGHAQSVLAITYNPEKKDLISISKDRTLRSWKIKPFPGEQLSQLPGYDGFIFSSDGSIICVWKGQRIEAFDLTMHSLGEYRLSHGLVRKLRTSGDNFLIFTTDNEIIQWSPANGRKRAYSLAFEPVDALLVDTSLIACNDSVVIIPRSKIFSKSTRLRFEDKIIGLDKYKNDLCITTQNGISIYNGRRLKGLFVDKGVRKAIYRQKNIYVLTLNGQIKIFDYHFKQKNSISLSKPVMDFEVSEDEKLILIKQIDGLQLITPQGDKIYEYSITGQVQDFAFNPNGKFFLAMIFDQKSTYLKHWVCSAQEVINYIDNIHYFGRLPKFETKTILSALK